MIVDESATFGLSVQLEVCRVNVASRLKFFVIPTCDRCCCRKTQNKTQMKFTASCRRRSQIAQSEKRQKLRRRPTNIAILRNETAAELQRRHFQFIFLSIELTNQTNPAPFIRSLDRLRLCSRCRLI